jgi:gas vesicle protein
MSPHLSSALWFLAGGIAGAGIGLLLAPQSARATRQSMGRGMSGGARSARRLRDRVVSRSEEIWDEAAQRVDDLALLRPAWADIPVRRLS